MRYKTTEKGNIPFTQEEEDQRDRDELEWVAKEKAREIKDAAETLKLTGIEILGVMCSATGRDQDKLAAVAIGVMLVRASGNKFPDSVFEFKNGNELLITDENFSSVYPKWFAFRQSFFKSP